MSMAWPWCSPASAISSIDPGGSPSVSSPWPGALEKESPLQKKLLYSAGPALALLACFFFLWETGLRPANLSGPAAAGLLSLALVLALGGAALLFRCFPGRPGNGGDTEQDPLRHELTKLKKSQAALEEFAAVAAHDLQEPLRKVALFGDRLKERLGESLDSTGADYLRRMQDATARMQVLIDALLEFARIDSEARPFTRVDLNAVLVSVQSDLEPRIARAGARVRVEPLPTLPADKVQMQQLFQNLISNALKFHPPGEPPDVLVEARRDPLAAGMWLIRVADRGIGIADQHRERVFKPFERLHGRGVYEGSGMGLAICERIAKRHGGTIQVESVQEGSGTAFVVRLPERAAGLPPGA